MISTDRKIFEEGSAVRARMIEYGKLFDELHIVVFTKRNLKMLKRRMRQYDQQMLVAR